MAINFTVSYTFSSNTVISSSQVNTNFSDEANVWTGLEGLTKTFAKLKVDVNPATALEVATKQYVDVYSTYRRPVLQYNSATVVNAETGINGTSGQLAILFPDGTLRTDSTAGRIQCNLAQVAKLTATAQSGLQTGTVATNTWYAIYAVKSQVNTTDIVLVADGGYLPIQANFAQLNTNYGANSWVYLGLIRNGDNSGTTNAILSFKQTGNMTMFTNKVTGNSNDGIGTRMVSTASGSSTTYTYAAGVGTAQIPQNISIGSWSCLVSGGSVATQIKDATTASFIQIGVGTAAYAGNFIYPVTNGITAVNGSAVAMDINLSGFFDNVLGVGSNPIL